MATALLGVADVTALAAEVLASKLADSPALDLARRVVLETQKALLETPGEAAPWAQKYAAEAPPEEWAVLKTFDQPPPPTGFCDHGRRDSVYGRFRY